MSHRRIKVNTVGRNPDNGHLEMNNRGTILCKENEAEVTGGFSFPKRVSFIFASDGTAKRRLNQSLYNRKNK